LRDAIPCPDAVYFEWDHSHRLVVKSSDLDVPPELVAPGEALGAERPTAAGRLRPGDGAVRLSQRIGRRELRRLPFYRRVMRPLGIEDELVLRVSTPGPRNGGLSLIRDRPFTDRERRMLELVGPYVTLARERATLATRRRVGVLLSDREWEVLACVARGKTNKEIAALLLIRPNTVRKHLERIFEKLGVHTRTAAIARAFSTPTL
jgi:DNA-binding CsgD family transcriptional regulator